MNIRFLLFRLLVAAGLTLMTRAASSQEFVTLEEISQTRESSLENIQTIFIQYDWTVKFLADPAGVISEFGQHPAVGRTSVVNALHRDGRSYHSVAHDWDLIQPGFEKSLGLEFPDYKAGKKTLVDLPFDRVTSIAESEFKKLAGVVNAGTLTVFDGRKTWQQTDETFEAAKKSFKAWGILNPDRVSGPIFPKSLLQELCITFPIPALKNDDLDRRASQLSTLLSSGEFKIVAQSISCNGNDCIALESDRQKLFLDSSRGFAVVSRIWKWHDGNPVYSLDSFDFTEIAPGLWIPRRIESTQYGASGIGSGQWAGLPVYKRLYLVTELEINDAKHLELFSVNPQPGEVIVDQTLSAVRDDGLAAAVTPHTTGGGEIPTISYTVPADNAKLDEVIRDAQRVAAMRPEPPPMLSSILGGSRRFLWFFVVSLVILGALGAKWLRG